MISYSKLDDLSEKLIESDIRKNMALTEASFYGKNVNLIEIESQIQIIIDACHSKGAIAFSTDAKVDKALRRMEILIAKTFGFEDVSINSGLVYLLAPGAFMAPGSTVPIGAIYKYGQVLKANGDLAEGIVFDGHKSVKLKSGSGMTFRTVIGAGMFCDHDENSLTAQEIMAIIMHEIGHNFFQGPITEFSDYALMLMDPASATRIPGAIISRELMQTGVSKIESNLDPANKQTLKSISNTLSGIFGVAMTTISPIISIIKNVVVILSRLLDNSLVNALTSSIAPSHYLRAAIKYDTEKYADAFATSFGYGADLDTALVKMDYIMADSTLIKNTFTKSVIRQLTAIIKLILVPLMLVDEHPNTIGRAKNNIDYMKSVCTTDMSPALRKEYETALDELITNREAVKSYKGFDIGRNTDAASAIIQDLIHVSDIKDLTSRIKSFTKYKNLDI